MKASEGVKALARESAEISVQWFLERLAEFEDETALIWRDQKYSYRQLLGEVDQWRQRLAGFGIEAGESVVLYGDYSPNTCMLLLALAANGNIAVPLTYAVGENKESYMEIAKVTAVFDFDRQDNWQFSRRAASGSHPLLDQLRARSEPGLVVFSSGSTGECKASLHSLNRVLAKFQKRRHRFRALTFLLLDHLGGINTLFYILSNGGTVISINERSPQAVCEAVERYRVQLMPVTPTFLNMLMISEAYERYDLSSLELITYGTEPMPASTLQSLNKIFPNVELKQTYGLSELGVMRTQSLDSESLWVKVGGEGVETKIVNGTLWIKTEAAMLGYLNAPSPFDEEGWFNTQDAVEVNGDYIRILGRTSEIINVGGEKVYPSEVESVLLQMSNVKDVTISRKSNPVTGNIVVATMTLFEPEEPDALERRMREFCKDKLAPYKIPLIVKVTEDPLHGDRFKKMRNTAG